MNVLAIYEGSNGEATKALYARLETIGAVGVVAVNLFRAQKCSARAKVYRGGGFKGKAYERKNWSMQNLCRALEESAAALGIAWGWRLDPAQAFHRWVLYVELPTGQVSFHSETRLSANDYEGDWDGVRDASASRIIRWVSAVLES